MPPELKEAIDMVLQIVPTEEKADGDVAEESDFEMEMDGGPPQAMPSQQQQPSEGVQAQAKAAGGQGKGKGTARTRRQSKAPGESKGKDRSRSPKIAKKEGQKQ